MLNTAFCLNSKSSFSNGLNFILIIIKALTSHRSFKMQSRFTFHQTKISKSEKEKCYVWVWVCVKPVYMIVFSV